MTRLKFQGEQVGISTKTRDGDKMLGHGLTRERNLCEESRYIYIYIYIFIYFCSVTEYLHETRLIGDQVQILGNHSASPNSH
jgi:hypothetical protein